MPVHRRHGGIAPGTAAGARGALPAPVCPRSLHVRADEHRGKLNALATAARSTAAAVNLVAVVLVVRDPVNPIQGRIVAAQGVIIVVPEALQTLLFCRQARSTLGKNVPPRLITTVAARSITPAGVGTG